VLCKDAERSSPLGGCEHGYNEFLSPIQDYKTTEQTDQINDNRTATELHVVEWTKKRKGVMKTERQQ
jgi:hypothetical protein